MPYCDFNSHVREGVEQARWRQALLTELEHAAREAPGRRVETMFFGGGTPSLMEPETVAALIARTRSLWDTADDIEITLEANPTSVEASRFAALAQAGVNRVSLGIQALDPAALKFLGREHSVDEALAALETARAALRTPFLRPDLCPLRPDAGGVGRRAGPSAWPRRRAPPRSISSPSSAARSSSPSTPAAPSFCPSRTKRPRCTNIPRHGSRQPGLPAYEISSHARPGAACRHNLIYWRYRDYVGIGPGAHGRFAEGATKKATRRASGPEAWLEAAERDGHGTAETSSVEGRDLVEEALMMGLRLADGIDRATFAAVTGADPVESVGEAKLAPLIEAGFLDVDAAHLRATPAGQQRLNALLERLIA